MSGPFAGRSPIYAGAWAGRPNPAALPDGAGMFVTDVGVNGGSDWRVASGVWRLANPTIIRWLEAPVTGLAQLAEQNLWQFSLPRSLIAAFRQYGLTAVVSKSGPNDAATSIYRIGTNGGVALDTGILTINWNTSDRARSWGHMRIFNTTLNRDENHTVAIAASEYQNSSGTAAYPTTPVNIASDVPVFYTWSCTMSSTLGPDTLTLQRAKLEAW